MINHLTLFRHQKIVVIGDLMLDTYTIGKASRISPEAPVPILLVKEEKSLPGGAGNVALNLRSLGQDVVLLGRCGADSAGQQLKDVLTASGIGIEALFVEEHYKTPVKNRIIADNQQMIRIDHEINTSLTPELERQIMSSLPSLLEGVSAIAISDYGKGFLSRTLLQGVIETAHKKNIIVVVDPKGHDFTKYKGAHVLKPNLKETYLAAGLPPDVPLDEVAVKLLNTAKVDNLLVTRSEDGISLFDLVSRKDFPVKVKEVKDVTGAGDTVLATLTASLASGMSLEQAAELSNVAASLAIEHVGCARITLQDIATRLLEDHAEKKHIDALHAPALHFALKTKPHTIIELTDESILDPALYKKIQSLKVSSDHAVVMKLPATLAHPSLPSMLASLKEVDFVLWQ